MKTSGLLGAVMGAALLLSLTACGSAHDLANLPEPTATVAAPVVTPTPEPIAATPPAPVPTELTVTLYGTDATFIYSADGSTIQQLEHQTGPFTFTVPYTGQPVFVNASAAYGGTADVGCKVAAGDRVLMDKTEPDQISAVCQGKVG